MTTYTQSNRLAQMVPRDPAVRDQWGTIWDNTCAAIDQSLDGNAAININGLTTFSLSVSNNAPDQSRQRQYNFTGALTADCTVTMPAVPKIVLASNGTSGGHFVILTTGSGRTSSVAPGQSVWISCDGTNVDTPVFAGTTPIGGTIAFAGSTAPPRWLLCAGQAVSRTTYALLFTVIGTTYGTGDGSTTFNLPDLRGRAVFGKDNMNGIAAARLTVTNSGITGTTLGAAGGDERSQLHTHGVTDPGHTHTVSDPGHTHAISDPGHNHVLNDPGHAHAVSDPGHVHGVNDPGHSHTFNAAQIGASGYAVAFTGVQAIQEAGGSTTGNGSNISINLNGTNIGIFGAFTGMTINGAFVGVSNVAAATNITLVARTTGITLASAFAGGSQNVPPAIVMNQIIYAGV